MRLTRQPMRTSILVRSYAANSGFPFSPFILMSFASPFRSQPGLSLDSLADFYLFCFEQFSTSINAILGFYLGRLVRIFHVSHPLFFVWHNDSFSSVKNLYLKMHLVDGQ